MCRYTPPPPSSDNDNNDEVAGSNRIGDVTPPTANVRSRVHEYGGGAVIFGNHDGSDIYYTEFTTQRLCRLVDEDRGSIPITIAAGDDDTTSSSTTTTNNNYRYADGVLSSNGKYIYCIREDHTIPTNVINEKYVLILILLLLLLAVVVVLLVKQQSSQRGMIFIPIPDYHQMIIIN